MGYLGALMNICKERKLPTRRANLDCQIHCDMILTALMSYLYYIIKH